MEQGPAAGLYTTPLHAEQYNNVCTVVDQYINSDMEREKKSLMVSKLAPWIYLYADTLCDAPMTWRVSMNAPDVMTYFTDGVHSIPDYCLVLKPEYGEFVDNYIGTWGDGGDPIPNYNDEESWLKNEMLQAGYEEIDTVCGVLYRK